MRGRERERCRERGDREREGKVIGEREGEVIERERGRGVGREREV